MAKSSLKKLTILMESYQFELHRDNKHLVWKHRLSGAQIYTSKTSSDQHAMKQIERDIKKVLKQGYVK